MFAEVKPRLEKSLPLAIMVLPRCFGSGAQRVGPGRCCNGTKACRPAVAIDEAAIKAGGEGSYYMPTLLINRARLN